MIADALSAAADLLGPGVLVVAALVLVAESGLLVGVVLPGISVTVGLGVLAGTGAVPGPAAVTAAVTAAVAGPSLGYWRARSAGAGPLRGGARVPPPARRVLRLAEARPVVALALGQWFAVARTLVPRVAGPSLRYPRFLLVSVPVAAAWALATFGLGRLLVAGSAVAAGLVSVQEILTWVLLGALAVAVGWTVVRTARARRAARS
ncbi:DedA family protein [Pseudonocardia sp. HH130630-07]|uniref:DedA family protein n=1 Tax=Pseudonocardia sp. HH130630-07 TaxID=1690815 RepID=UPI000814E648|nr:hypothetical protein [Pseudonocardia sp. HH130630-07]ANY05575.1 hypothetical protein AFB00_03805 [Pseudonocardia sp. HH130630-07]